VQVAGAFKDLKGRGACEAEVEELTLLEFLVAMHALIPYAGTLPS